jgi:hypothetical protein
VLSWLEELGGRTISIEISHICNYGLALMYPKCANAVMTPLERLARTGVDGRHPQARTTLSRRWRGHNARLNRSA